MLLMTTISNMLSAVVWTLNSGLIQPYWWETARMFAHYNVVKVKHVLIEKYPNLMPKLSVDEF